MKNNYRILNKVNYPDDLKKLSEAEIKQLCSEIRKFLLENVSRSGGHLASNLGVVELTCALHYCFDMPFDKIVWDVGHQCYVHKILTGRKNRFGGLRQKDGLSGFTKMSESVYDSFGAGHASTSVSAALGLAAARDLSGKENKVIAVIGDGAITGGLAFEGLNNAGADRVFGASKANLPTDLIVVLNDNEMSISKNVGALSKHLNDLRTAPLYLGAKEDVHSVLNKFAFGRPIAGIIEKAKEKLKYALIPGVLFEEMGFSYYGPIDGHDIHTLINVLNKLKPLNEPVVLHVYTKKGKGYRFAEDNPRKFHGAPEFDTSTGNDKKAKTESFSDVFGKEIAELGARNTKIAVITAAMKDGCGLNEFAEKFPERFFDVGIAEGHAAVFGAGLSAGGFIPVFAVYSTFLQRAYDNIIHDICLQNLPFIFAIDRAGVLPGDGPTHQGIFDISFLSHIPNISIMAPCDSVELKQMLEFASGLLKPVAIRYPKDNSFTLDINHENIEYGKSRLISDGKDIALVAVGTMLRTALNVADMLKNKGYEPCIVNARFVKPFDKEMLDMLAGKCRYIFTIEDGVTIGGFGEQVSDYMRKFPDCCVKIFAHGDCFPENGSRSELLAQSGLDAASIYDKIIEELD